MIRGFPNYRCRYMWQQKWRRSKDLHFLFPRLMVMLGLPCDGLVMSQGAHLTGPILFCGVFYVHCQSRWLMLGVWTSALEFEGEGSWRIPGRKNRKHLLYLIPYLKSLISRQLISVSISNWVMLVTVMQLEAWFCSYSLNKA